MKKVAAIIIGLIILFVLLLFSMTYSVGFNQVALKSHFGKVDASSIIREPGLHFRWPFFADSVTTYDTRVQLIQPGEETLQTSDGLQVVVKGFLLWKVDVDGEGPLHFYQSYPQQGDAEELLIGEFRDVVSVVSEYEFSDLIGPDNKLEQIEQKMFERVTQKVGQGIKPVTIGLSRVLLREKTSQQVISRMRASRDTLAENARARGEAEAQRIKSEAKTIRDKIYAFAEQRSQEIRTRADERSAKYLREMSEDEELAIFLIWIDTLEKALAKNTTVIIDTDFAPWHLMKPEPPEGELTIPKPNSYMNPVDSTKADAEAPTRSADKGS
ncbi:MAG: SPFH domain-containing protein [Phycisphaerales bacterium]|nr:SPFH domain-containing protein [Phycisphaerales bacterium]